MTSPRSSIYAHSIFSNECSELLDYLEEDHKFSIKTFSHTDFLSDVEPEKKREETKSKQSIMMSPNGDKEEFLFEIPDHTTHVPRKNRTTILPQVPKKNSSPKISSEGDIRVYEPITETKNKKQYTSYLLKTGSVEVRRRWSEYLNFYEKLKKDFPNKQFPVNAEKNFFGRFDQELIVQRMQHMQEFLRFCIGDVEIKTHVDFQLFIQK